VTLDDERPKFQFPAMLEKALAFLSEHYRKKDRPDLQKLLVNSKYYVEEGYDYDNWNGGSWGHAIHFLVPSNIYHEIHDSIDKIEDIFGKDISRINKCPNEYLAKIFIELQDDKNLENWREKSGVLMSHDTISEESHNKDLEKIWQPHCLRLFLSHKSDYKAQASELKAYLSLLGISAFVAHEDIKPTKEWQGEIEKALFSMHALVALMTEGFSNSKWTDQEIGVAIGRKVPIFSVKLGEDPYGFIGKYQAISGGIGSPQGLGYAIIKALMDNPNTRERITEALVYAFENSESFKQSNDLMEFLKMIECPNPEIADRLEKAYEKNINVYKAFDVKSSIGSLLKKLRGEK
jgi:hypothetical protein